MEETLFETYNNFYRNRVRFTILMYLRDNKTATITELVNFVIKHQKRNYDYKAIYNHLKLLEDGGVVLLKKKKKGEQGRPVYARLKNTKEFEEYLKSFTERLTQEFAKGVLQEIKKDKLTRSPSPTHK